MLPLSASKYGTSSDGMKSQILNVYTSHRSRCRGLPGIVPHIEEVNLAHKQVRAFLYFSTNHYGVKGAFSSSTEDIRSPVETGLVVEGFTLN